MYKLICVIGMLLILLQAGCSERLEPGICGYRNAKGELIRLKPEELNFEIPLYHEFIDSHEQIIKRIPEMSHFNFLGSDFDSNPKSFSSGGYSWTPINSVSFASTGGDGVHFSFLIESNLIDKDTPIIMTVPMNSDLPNIVLAKNFEDFLKLGLNHGFFGLEELSYEPEKAFAILIDPDWTTQKQTGWETLIDSDQQSHRGLDATRKRLKLGPCKLTKKEFDDLQEKYLPMLILPDHD